MTTLLSKAINREEIKTTLKEKDYDIQIQGSDRTHPAIVIRKKHRGKGATILTISKKGKYSDLYDEYEETIRKYVDNRKRRDGQHTTTVRQQSVGNKDNGEITATRYSNEGGVVATRESWLAETLQSVVKERRRDNSS